MIAHIVKGSGFAGTIKYLFKPDKQGYLIDADGIRLKDVDSIIRSFEVQAGMNPRLSNPVCHIALCFSPEDKDKITDDFMRKIAREYMQKMGQVNTQYIVVRHNNTEHPHCHIIFNRVNNLGKTISDSRDFEKSTRICRELTEKYGLFISPGKENVNQEKLREPDKTKYEIYDALKEAVPLCRNWDELKAELLESGISVEFKTKGETDEIQGVKFMKNGYVFNGSKVDRQFSYSKLNAALSANAHRQEVSPVNIQPETPPVFQDHDLDSGQNQERGQYQWPENNSFGHFREDDFDGSFYPGGYDPELDPDEKEARRRRKKNRTSQPK